MKSACSVCHDILCEARQFNVEEFRIIASATVVDMLLDAEGQHLADVSESIGNPISLQANPGGSPEQHDIVLM